MLPRSHNTYTTVMYLWAIPVMFCLFGCSKIGRPILGMYKTLTNTCMWKSGDEHYSSVLEITRLRSFISADTKIWTQHFFWIFTGPLFIAGDSGDRRTDTQMMLLHNGGFCNDCVWITQQMCHKTILFHTCSIINMKVTNSLMLFMFWIILVY